MSKERVMTIIAEHAGIALANVKPEASLRSDLGMDSLDALELEAILEKEFSISINDEDVETWDTVGDVLKSCGA